MYIQACKRNNNCHVICQPCILKKNITFRHIDRLSNCEKSKEKLTRHVHRSMIKENMKNAYI